MLQVNGQDDVVQHVPVPLDESVAAGTAHHVPGIDEKDQSMRPRICRLPRPIVCLGQHERDAGGIFYRGGPGTVVM